jgi:putative acetyltransferase
MTTVRPERPGDQAAIFAVLAACFPSDAEARLVDLLRAAGRLDVSLVAEVDGAIVGHVAFSPVTTANGAIGTGLAPVGVLAEYRQRGIAAELIRAGLDGCRAARFGWAVVLGEPEYYGRFGFRPAAEFGLSDEYGGGPAFQALELTPGSLPCGTGLVRYAPEFAMFA